MSRASTTLILLAVLTLCATSARGADVFVIPAGMPSAAIQTVIDGAADGDILLFDPGAHGNSVSDVLAIDGKGVALVGRGPTRPSVAGLTVSNVPAGSNVVLAGLEFAPGGLAPFGPAGFTAIEIDDCAGGVLIEDCLVPDTFSVGGVGLGGIALDVANAAVVTVSRSELHSVHAEDSLFCIPVPGFPALRAIASNVSVHASMLVGGTGGFSPDMFCTGGPGGDAVQVGPDFGTAEPSHVVLSGNTLTGGPNGGSLGSPPDGTGRALQVHDADSVAWLADNVSTGGVVAPSGTVVEYLNETARGLSVSSPTVENQAASITLTGIQGDLIGIFWSFDTGWIPMSSRAGTFVMGAPLAGPIVLGLHPGPDGDWIIPITGPALPPGIDGQYAFMQAFVKDPGTGAIRLSSPTVYTLVDDAL